MQTIYNVYKHTYYTYSQHVIYIYIYNLPYFGDDVKGITATLSAIR